MYDLEHLRSLGIIQYPDPLLATRSAPVEEFGSDTKALVERMLEVCRLAPGAGLSAVQIGELKRIFIADTSRGRDQFEPTVFINPELELVGDEIISIEEGCLSFANIWIPVKRSGEVSIRYQDISGKRQVARCKDLLSIIVQHEFDHLEGLTFLDRISRLRRETALRKGKKWARAVV